MRINQGNVNVDKHEWFEYLVDAKNGQPITLEIQDAEFEHGTLVRHIAMDLGKYVGAVTQLTNSLWYLSHNYLFDTIFPFTITDERANKTKKDKGENRTVQGNNRRHTLGDTTEYPREVPLTFRDGKVIIYYWVLSQEGLDKPKDRIKLYTLSSQPIVITFNGQKQGTLPNSIIKNELKLPFLESYLIVQIECDKLDNESKRQLFSSTRESLRDTSILEELKKLTIDTLNEDENLQRLDRERKERYLKNTDTKAEDKLRVRLAKRINTFIKNSGGGTMVKATETKESVKTKKQQPIPFEEMPTFLNITTPSPKQVIVGKTFSIKFKTDAHPNYFFNPDNFLAFIEPHSFGSFTGNANVVDGYGIAYFTVREDIEIGTESKITLELRPPRQKTLSSSIDCIAIATPEDSNPDKPGNKNTPNINIHPVSETGQYYKDNFWNYETVAKVESSKASIDIFINDSNKNLTKLIGKAKNHGEQATDAIKERYREHIAFTAFMISQNKIDKLINKEDNDGKEISDEIIERIQSADLANACEAICGVINDFFQIIITENKED